MKTCEAKKCLMFNFCLLQPTLLTIDLIRSFKRLQSSLPKKLLLRWTVLSISTIFLLYHRLKLQNFETPVFRVEDNPVAFSDSFLTRTLTQNYLYFINMWLLILPEWLSFDWSFLSIELIHSFSDVRIIFVMAFYFVIIGCFCRGLKQRYDVAL
jgi:hypothetical protein